MTWRGWTRRCSFFFDGEKVSETDKDWSAAPLIAKMNRSGIAEAAVHPMEAYAREPWKVSGLAADRLPRERLHPVYVVGPHHCGEFPAPAVLSARMEDRGAAIARPHCGPKGIVRSLDFCLLEELFGHLAEHRVVLFLDTVDSGDFLEAAQLKTLLGGWPSMPVILGIAKVEQHDRIFYNLW